MWGMYELTEKVLSTVQRCVDPPKCNCGALLARLNSCIKSLFIIHSSTATVGITVPFGVYRWLDCFYETTGTRIGYSRSMSTIYRHKSFAKYRITVSSTNLSYLRSIVHRGGVNRTNYMCRFLSLLYIFSPVLAAVCV